MKKALLVIATLLVSAVAFAQSVATPNAGLQLNIKGIQKAGGNVEITFLLTNKSNSEAVVNLVGGQYQTGMSGSIAYDNEGNIYELGDVLVAVGKKAYTEQYCGVSIPAGVGVKCRACIKNVDPAATQLSFLKLCFLCPQLQINNTGVGFEITGIKF